jgi:hypothetical protein
VVQMFVREIIQCFAYIYFSCNFLSMMMCQTLNELYKTLVLCNDYIEDTLLEKSLECIRLYPSIVKPNL